MRNEVWADPEAFYRDTAQKAPGKFRPWYNLGSFLGRTGRIEEARGPLARAVELNPNHSEARNQLGNVLMLSGQPDQALEEYRAAVRIAPNVEAIYNLAMLADTQGLTEEAMEHYRRFVELAPPSLAEYIGRARSRLQQLGGGPDLSP